MRLKDRLISDNVLKKIVAKMVEVPDEIRVKFYSAIDQAPAVDAEEVVRCGECMFRHTRPNCQGRRLDFFCGDGKRRRDSGNR